MKNTRLREINTGRPHGFLRDQNQSPWLEVQELYCAIILAAPYFIPLRGVSQTAA